MSASVKQGPKGWSNTAIAIACLAFFSGMIGLAYASVPLYQLFCQVTGYGGTTQRTQQASAQVLDETINVRFDANTNGIGWEFKPKQRQVQVKIGETVQIAYEARNFGSAPSTGTATFNVTPQAAGAYFNKIECFCFTETTLGPGESLDMPVVFFIDPEIVDAPELKNIKTITLSYTFFPVDDPQPVAQSGAGADRTTTIR
ncbi:cytochrome c oxidase assembly protein [Oricola cellulosilytica]|uniref:Cytochrome c oxidase assembly protein CtaG n=1 Tax=Oricola cellulosilytica TaxID=1429082 RepID=A0A4V2MNM4_9HYPH|nr:cytochrome c oxidase assembly protein [Oricola cellulosilytica]TCD13469.1 cytochrome c oxidase assembly protein [Oricola cellulosilytica]